MEQIKCIEINEKDLKEAALCSIESREKIKANKKCNWITSLQATYMQLVQKYNGLYKKKLAFSHDDLLYIKARARLVSELDIKRFINCIRYTQNAFKVLLTERQRYLIKM